MIECSNCGKETESHAAFCMHCGARVSDVTNVKTETIDVKEPSGSTALLELLRKATLGEYEVLTELGRGGMAAVFLAHDLSLDRKVAIKVMLPKLAVMGDEIVERFRREAKTAAAMSHPHIIPIYAVKDSHDLAFFVMKFVKGRSLESVVREEGRLPLGVTQTILNQVGSALDYAHRHHVIHRDIKPGNIMLDEEGWAVVTDFGIAKATEAKGLTLTGVAMGTPTYMSPEQCNALELTGAADQYSLGIVAYEMLTGTLPFEGDSAMTVMYRHAHEPPPPVVDRWPECPPRIADAINRMLEKDPADRFPTVADAIEAVGTAEADDENTVRTKMLTIVKSGGNQDLLARFQTPRSPLPIRTQSRPSLTTRSKKVAPAGARSTRGRVIGVASLVLLPVLGVTAWLALGRDAQPASPIEDPVVNVPADEPTGDPVATAQSEPADQPAEGVEDPPPPSQPEGRPAPRVQPRVTSLALTPADPTVIRGGEVQLTPAVRDQNGALMSGRPASWRSSATNVATVSGDGLVRGLAPGRAEVTASVDGVSATVLVTVTTVPVASVVVSPSALALDVGASSTLRVEVFGADGNALEGRAVNWSVQGSAARVSDGGRVEALEAGRATVTARADAYSSSSTITVTAPEPPARDEPARDEPAPPDPSVDRREVLGVLDRYRNAIEAEDLDALRAVYPGLTSQQESAWSAFFANADGIRMEIDPGTPRIDGDRATVRVGGVQRFRAGGEQEQPLTFTATLERTGRGWQLVRVQ